MESRTDEPILLWDVRPEDEAACLHAGCGAETAAQRADNLARDKAYALSIGRQVMVMTTPVAEVLAQLQRLGMACTPASVMLALRMIYNAQRVATRA